MARAPRILGFKHSWPLAVGINDMSSNHVDKAGPPFPSLRSPLATWCTRNFHALHLTATGGHFEAIQILLDNGATVDAL